MKIRRIKRARIVCQPQEDFFFAAEMAEIIEITQSEKSYTAATLENCEITSDAVEDMLRTSSILCNRIDPTKFVSATGIKISNCKITKKRRYHEIDVAEQLDEGKQNYLRLSLTQRF